MKLQNIVAATDFSEASMSALETARTLALESGAVLHLVHVIETHEAVYPMLARQKEDETEARERLRAFLPAEWRRSVTLKTEILLGRPEEAISRFARQIGADMIVVGTHGRTGLTRILLGSTAEGLLRRAPCQVLVVKHTIPVRV